MEYLIHHSAICVNDFDRALNFHVDFLGFEKEDEMDNRKEPNLSEVVGLEDACIRWAMLKLGTHRIELFKYYSPQGTVEPRRQCDFGYNHLGIQVQDVEATYRKCLEKNYTTLSEPKVLRGGKTKVFYVCEPEGAVTEFIQFL